MCDFFFFIVFVFEARAGLALRRVAVLIELLLAETKEEKQTLDSTDRMTRRARKRYERAQQKSPHSLAAPSRGESISA